MRIQECARISITELFENMVTANKVLNTSLYRPMHTGFILSTFQVRYTAKILNRELSFKSRSSKQYYFVEINQHPKIEKWIKFLEKEKESLSRKKTYLFEIMLEQWMMPEYAIRHSISSKSLHSRHSSLHQLLKFNAPSA